MKRAAMNNFCQILATQIYYTRRSRGWTQRELAEHAKLSVATISRCERGVNILSIRIATLSKIAAALDIALRVFIQSPYDEFNATPCVKSYTEEQNA